MPRLKSKQHAPLHKVKQLIETDFISVANILIERGDWILITTCKKFENTLFYVLGRVEDYKNEN